MEPARKFKIIVNSKECGTCSGLTPSAVAKKVVKKLCGSSSKVVKFSLKECKRGSERMCGPYQGRMEKLDRPFKRDGKKITHRVVCGKVRKMRGGRELTVADFEKREDNYDFKFDIIGLRPHIFFGEVIELNNKQYYKWVVFNNELWGGNKKTCGFSKIHVGSNNTPYIVQNTAIKVDSNSQDSKQNIVSIKYLMSLLVSYKYRNDYKTIKKELKKLVPVPDPINQNEYTICEFVRKNYNDKFMLWTGYFESDITGYFNNIINSINGENMADLFKKKNDIKSYTNKKSMFKSFTSYYSVIDVSETQIIFIFSKNENDEYYNLSFNYNNKQYIAIYDADNKIATCYLTKLSYTILEYYPTDFVNITSYCFAAFKGIESDYKRNKKGNVQENGNGNGNGN